MFPMKDRRTSEELMVDKHKNYEVNIEINKMVIKQVKYLHKVLMCNIL